MQTRTPLLAVVLAAGRGKRLYPYTKTTPKPLLQYKNKSIISYVIDSIRNTDIDDICIVTNYLEDILISELTNRDRLSKFIFQHQKSTLGSSDGLLAAKDVIHAKCGKNKWVLVTAADYCFPQDYINNFVLFHRSHDSDISISIRPIPNKPTPESSIVIHNENMDILEIIEKPQIPDSKSHTAASLLYIVPSEIVAFSDKAIISPRGEYELPLIINSMLSSGYTAKGYLQPLLPEWESKYKKTSQDSCKISSTRS